MNVEIKKGRGIDGLVSGEPKTQDTTSSVSTISNDRLEAALMMVEDAPYWPVEEFRKAKLDTEFVRRRSKHVLILTPAELNSIVNSISPTSEREAHTQSLVINRLIQMSYDHGHNGFRLDIDFPDLSCFHIMGTQERPLELHLNGENLFTCGQDMHYCNIEIDSMYASFLGGGSNNTFTFNGRFDDMDTPCSYSTFRTSNPDTIADLYRQVPPTNNRIILIKDGKEEIFRDWNDKR